jgi:hypothetical protein
MPRHETAQPAWESSSSVSQPEWAGYAAMANPKNVLTHNENGPFLPITCV